jgi:hypothetical protein
VDTNSQTEHSNEEEEAPRFTSAGREIPPPIEDIDPRDWLTSDDSAVIGYVNTRAGRLKIAALTESETDMIRKGSEKLINPGKPNSGKRIDLKKLRVLTASQSINKANKDRPGYIPLMPDDLEKKLAGEITAIVNAISKLSGYGEEEEDTLNTFLQVS